MSVIHYSYLDKEGRGVSKVHHSEFDIELREKIEAEIRDLFGKDLPEGLAFGVRHTANSFDEKICFHCCQDRIQQGKCVPHASGFIYYEGQADQYGHRFDVCQTCITNCMISN